MTRQIIATQIFKLLDGRAQPPGVFTTLVLPDKNGIPIRLYDYLCVQRGIDGDIVYSLMQKEKLYEDGRGNVVYVRHDENGKARFASMRGTWGNHRFRMDCAGSDKRYAYFQQARDNPSRDVQRLDQVLDIEDRYADFTKRYPSGPLPAEVAEIGWLIEEFRVSVFAQAMRTLVPVSAKRIGQAISTAERDLPK